MNYTLTVDGKTQDRFSEKAIARTDLPAPDGKANSGREEHGEEPALCASGAHRNTARR